MAESLTDIRIFVAAYEERSFTAAACGDQGAWPGAAVNVALEAGVADSGVVAVATAAPLPSMDTAVAGQRLASTRASLNGIPRMAVR